MFSERAHHPPKVVCPNAVSYSRQNSIRLFDNISDAKEREREHTEARQRERQRVRAKKREREGNRKLTKERESALKQDRERDRERELKTDAQYKTLVPFFRGGGCKSLS